MPAARLRAERPNHVWALDVLFDATSEGRQLKVLSMCNEYIRENPARRVGLSIFADDVVDVLDEAYRRSGAPALIRCDDGPDLVAVAIRDWCRSLGTGTACTDPGSPRQNPIVEGFNGGARDELFAREVFDSAPIGGFSGNVDGCEECRRSLADVVVGSPLDLAGQQ